MDGISEKEIFLKQDYIQNQQCCRNGQDFDGENMTSISLLMLLALIYFKRTQYLGLCILCVIRVIYME